MKDQHMKKNLLVSLALAGWFALPATQAGATTITENFSSNPLQDGWQIFGGTNLFQWDSTGQNLEVTWDSSQPNSYFCHPLGTILTGDDDFSLAFDLQLNDAEASGYGFELAVGFLNLAEATSTNFNRSTGENSPDLVEFTFFPATAYSDATVWPVFVDTNSDFNWNGAGDYAIYAPTPSDWYHIVMTYTASNLTMVTTMTNFEQTSGVTIIDPLDLTNAIFPFTDFRVDTISINSYQDDGLGDSIFAQGVVGNLVVTLPPTVRNLAGAFNNSIWQVQCGTYTNWLYALERTTDFIVWSDVSTANGNGDILILSDANAPADKAFYRIRADQP